MSSNILSALNIFDISSCILFSAAATIFYKKSFNSSGVPAVASLFTLAILLQNTGTLFISACIAMMTLFFVHLSIKNAETMKNAMKLDVFLPFLLVVLDVKFDILEMCGVNFAYSDNFKIIAAAAPQFVRRPTWLKAKLQGVRSRLGPIYIFYVTSYVTSITTTDGILIWTPILAGATLLACGVSAIVYNTDNSSLLDRNRKGTVVIFVFALIASILDPEESAVWASPVLAQLSVVAVAKIAMFTSILAGILLFRPDNSTMLELIGHGMKSLFDYVPNTIRPNMRPYKTSLAERRFYHGRLMICSLLCCICLTAAEVWLDKQNNRSVT